MINNNRINIIKRIKKRLEYIIEQWYRYNIEKIVISKNDFIEDIKICTRNNIGYSTGKVGLSQKYWMYYEIFSKKRFNKQIVKNFEEELNFHGLKQAGIFPADPKFYIDYNRFYMNHVMNLDCLGVFIRDDMWHIKYEYEIIKYYKLDKTLKLIYYKNQEPDRSTPNNDNNCYLKYLENKRILIICPFAKFLAERAKKEIFEGVWSHTGKKWFYPQHVDFIEFPYGFSADTHKKFNTAIDLFNHITKEINQKCFDVALIGASGLAIPLASHVKNMGKIGIDLGGHLQMIFGVHGGRWRTRKDFKGYFNDYWVEMPERYKPKKDFGGDYDYW